MLILIKSYRTLLIIGYFSFFFSPKKKGKAEPTKKVPNKNMPPINTWKFVCPAVNAVIREMILSTIMAMPGATLIFPWIYGQQQNIKCR